LKKKIDLLAVNSLLKALQMQGFVVWLDEMFAT